MATYYIHRLPGGNQQKHLIDYTDETMKNPRTFTNARTAYDYGLKSYGKDRFQLVKEIPPEYIEFELKDY